MSTRNRLLMPVAVILFGLTACTSTPVAAPPVAAPTSAAAPSAAPTSAAPAPSDVPATKTSDRTTGGVDCPSAKTLDKLAGLKDGWHFVPSSVECWKTWAWADPEGPTPGDGISLFQYKKGTGWRYHSSGSGYHCKEIGIHESAPFCQYP